MTNEIPDMIPNEIPGMIPNEIPNEIPNMIPNEIPNEIPNTLTTYILCAHTQVIDPTEGGQVIFTYDVEWEKSAVKWASRWDVYLQVGCVFAVSVSPYIIQMFSTGSK